MFLIKTLEKYPKNLWNGNIWKGTSEDIFKWSSVEVFEHNREYSRKLPAEFFIPAGTLIEASEVIPDGRRNFWKHLCSFSNDFLKNLLKEYLKKKKDPRQEFVL